MPKLSAGIVLWREVDTSTAQVLIVHPGGPFWARKDEGAWSIPKGEYDDGADPWLTAMREFEEEIGAACPSGVRTDLGEFKQPSGKVITAFAIGGNLDVSEPKSNTFEMEWPRGSGKMQTYPEVDRLTWADVALARVKLLKGQVPILDALMNLAELAGCSEGQGSMPADEQPSLF